MTANIPAVQIRDEMIRLGQFLKLANLIESGAEAKEVIADGLVSVNGEVEDRRGRQLLHRLLGHAFLKLFSSLSSSCTEV